MKARKSGRTSAAEYSHAPVEDGTVHRDGSGAPSSGPLRPLTSAEAFVFPKFIPVWLFWPVCAFGLYAAGEAVARASGQSIFRLDRALAAGLVGSLPLLEVWCVRAYSRVVDGYFVPIAENPGSMRATLEIDRYAMTNLTRLSSQFALGVGSAAIATVLYYGIPTDGWLTKLVALFTFGAAAMLGGKSQYMWIALVVSLGHILSHPVRVPFFSTPKTAVSAVQYFFFKVGAVLMALYFTLILFIWRGPYGLPPALFGWLLLLAGTQLAVFVGSVLHLHGFMKMLKDRDEASVSDSLARLAETSLASQDLQHLQTLSTLMDIRVKVQSLREWPFGTQSTLALLTALATAGIQGAIAVSQAMR